MANESYTELQLLEAIHSDPETTQADLAARAGVAVGTANWYLKRWSSKGYVKVKRIGRWKWRYLLTPSGARRKARLASRYVETSMTLYRETRIDARRLLGQVREAGFDKVVISGKGDIAEICALTCLELGLTVINGPDDHLPCLQVNGRNIELFWPASNDQRYSTDEQVAGEHPK